MEKINIGVIGCGYWGPNLIRNFVEIPNSEVVAVADLRVDRLAYVSSRYPKIQVTENYLNLHSMDLDAVVIATPASTHYKLAKEFLQAEKHVFVEKPLTLTSQHAKELIDLAAAKRKVLMVGHTFLYNTAVQTLKEIVVSGQLGKIYYVDSARLNLGLFQPNLNVLWDLAPHDISILLHLLDRLPESVSAHGTKCAIDGVYDNVYMNLVFPDNIMAHVHISWLDPCKVRRTTVVGSKKMVVYNDIEGQEKIKIYDKGVDVPAYTDSFHEFQANYHHGDILIPNVRFVEPLRLECQDFLDCITYNKEPCSNGLAGLRVVSVLEAAEQSLRSPNGKEAITW